MAEFDRDARGGGMAPTKSKSTFTLGGWVSENRYSFKSFLSNNQMVLGLTIVDIYWILEGLMGAILIWYGVSNVFNYQLTVINAILPGLGFLMIGFAILRVTNILEEEVNAINSFLIIALLVFLVNAYNQKVITNENAKEVVDRTFKYNPNLPTKEGLEYKGSEQPFSKTCRWYNTRTSSFLAGEQAKWCKDAVENKKAGAEHCECRSE